MDIEAIAKVSGLEPILGSLRDGDDVWINCNVLGGLERFAEAVATAEREACADCVPSNWCDSMLTGEKSVITGKGREGAVEAVLIAVKGRILARSNEPSSPAAKQSGAARG